MRSSLRRHLGVLGLAPGKTAAARKRLFVGGAAAPATGPYESEFSPRDYVSYLLHVDAEIEHALMVQYLYAAYSLGGPQVPAPYRATVRGWQEVILGIAKEEMGHLISVQNALRLIGSPLNLGREDYPWDVPFYPFPFTLEPLTLDSLAKYVYAESPADWTGPLADEIREKVHQEVDDPHRVGELFTLLISLLQDPDYVPDAAFQADTYPFQASWDEWGRGYAGGARGNSTGANPKPTPDVLVVPLASRDDAVNAMTQIAQQGEAPVSADPDAPSHFARFLKVYVEMKACAGQGWSASRPVAINPYVSLDPGMDPAEGLAEDETTSAITHPESRLWATLHNLRYRMLLTYLTHSFTLAGGLAAAGAYTPRGAIINATFGEMYNLRAISEILMQLPLGSRPGVCAGPPFQMPYTLDSPLGEPNRWRLHVDLIDAADRLVDALLVASPPERHTYLLSLREADRAMRQTALRILAGDVNLSLT